MDLNVEYKNSDRDIKGFVDSNWGENTQDRKSQTGYYFIWNGVLIPWLSRKQKTVELSTNRVHGDFGRDQRCTFPEIIYGRAEDTNIIERN